MFGYMMSKQNVLHKNIFYLAFIIAFTCCIDRFANLHNVQLPAAEHCCTLP